MRPLPLALRALVVAALLAPSISISACGDKRAPEDQIRGVVDDGVTALQKMDAAALADLIDDGYRDDKGRDARQVRAIALGVLRQGPVLIVTKDPVIALDGETATAQVGGYALQAPGAAPADVIQSRGRRFDVVVRLQRAGGRWLVVGVDGLTGAGVDE